MSVLLFGDQGLSPLPLPDTPETGRQSKDPRAVRDLGADFNGYTKRERERREEVHKCFIPFTMYKLSPLLPFGDEWCQFPPCPLPDL